MMFLLAHFAFILSILEKPLKRKPRRSSGIAAVQGIMSAAA
jgi:hypothetical protein